MRKKTHHLSSAQYACTVHMQLIFLNASTIFVCAINCIYTTWFCLQGFNTESGCSCTLRKKMGEMEQNHKLLAVLTFKTFRVLLTIFLYFMPLIITSAKSHHHHVSGVTVNCTSGPVFIKYILSYH